LTTGMVMRELSLFTGAGGGVWATRWLLGWDCVGYVELNAHCRRVIFQRIRDGMFDPAPIWGDVRSFVDDGWARALRGSVEVVTAGFPCQPFSVAGKRKAVDDERNMWPATADVLRQVRPRWALLENVPGLLAASHGYFGTVLGDLAEIGYDAEWTVLGAKDAGAPHKRDRLWILARLSDAKRYELRDKPRGSCREDWKAAPKPRDDGEKEYVANTESLRRGQRRKPEAGAERGPASRCSWWDEDPADVPEPESEQVGSSGQSWESSRQSKGTWSSQPRVGRVADGMANRIQRLRALGNGQVPAVAALAWRVLRSRFP